LGKESPGDDLLVLIRWARSIWHSVNCLVIEDNLSAGRGHFNCVLECFYRAKKRRRIDGSSSLTGQERVPKSALTRVSR
jgi:hypothetical protein